MADIFQRQSWTNAAMGKKGVQQSNCSILRTALDQPPSDGGVSSLSRSRASYAAALPRDHAAPLDPPQYESLSFSVRSQSSAHTELPPPPLPLSNYSVSGGSVRSSRASSPTDWSVLESPYSESGSISGGAPLSPPPMGDSRRNSHCSQSLQRHASSAGRSVSHSALYQPPLDGGVSHSNTRLPQKTGSLSRSRASYAPALPSDHAAPLDPPQYESLSFSVRSQSSAHTELPPPPLPLSNYSVSGGSVRSSRASSPTDWSVLESPYSESGSISGGAPLSPPPMGDSRRNSHCSQYFDPHKEIRAVLIGKTGNGKSASGNTILNQQVFKSILSPLSVTSRCKKVKGVVNGRRVTVIDTPGIFDNKYKEAVVVRKIKKCISLSAPGPHVFLIVIKLDKFTEEEIKAVELLQMVFGDKAADYSMVLFTHGDRLGNTRIEDFYRKSPQLRHLIAKCKQQYHVFNNNVSNNSQVSQLLAKIDRIVYANGGTFYTNNMFQEAEKAIQVQMKSLLKAWAEEKCREEEKLRAKFKGKQLQDQLKRLDEVYKKESRKKAEKKNKFIETGLIVAGAEVGLAIGVAAGTAGGPLCMGIGAAVGGAAGALVGLVAPAAVKKLKDKCTVQ